MQTFVKDESDEEEEDGRRKERQKESYRNPTKSRRWSRERERARERESKREGGRERGDIASSPQVGTYTCASDAEAKGSMLNLAKAASTAAVPPRSSASTR